MKTFNLSIFRRSLIVSVSGLTLLSLVAWSPPAGESIQVNGGIIEVRSSTAATANTFGNNPAVIAGNGNDLFKGGSSLELGRGLIAGSSNLLSSVGGYGQIVGNSNDVWGYSTLVVGNLNLVSNSASTVTGSTRYSVISGYANVINNNCESLLVGGKANTVLAYNSLVTGHSNTIGGATVGAPANHSAAIGQYNQIMATYGWTMGYSNTVSGSRGVAIGSGVTASNAYSIALGKFNAPMAITDVLVIGTGTTDTARSTALTVTSNGGVILGRAQGDISMGIYGGN